MASSFGHRIGFAAGELLQRPRQPYACHTAPPGAHNLVYFCMNASWWPLPRSCTWHMPDIQHGNDFGGKSQVGNSLPPHMLNKCGGSGPSCRSEVPDAPWMDVNEMHHQVMGQHRCLRLWVKLTWDTHLRLMVMLVRCCGGTTRLRLTSGVVASSSTSCSAACPPSGARLRTKSSMLS